MEVREPAVSQDLAVLLELLRAGRLDPQVDRFASWHDAEPVLAALAAREIRGKAVLLVGRERARARQGPRPPACGW